MTNFTKIHLLVTAGLIIVILFMRSCSPKCNSTTVTKIIPGETKFVKVTDTLYKDRKVYVSIPGETYVSHDTIYLHTDQVATKTDSSKASIACLQSRVRRDTLKQNEVILVRYDSLYMNDFAKSYILIKNTRPQTVIADNKAKLFAGFQLGTNLKLSNIVVAPELVLTTKKDAMYSLSYDIVSQTTEIGLLWKIKLK